MSTEPRLPRSSMTSPYEWSPPSSFCSPSRCWTAPTMDLCGAGRRLHPAHDVRPQSQPHSCRGPTIRAPSVQRAHPADGRSPQGFRAGIGTTLTSAVAILWARGIGTPVVLAIGMVMIIFAALGSIIGLWVGCKAFSILMKLALVPEEICVQCADISLHRDKVADCA